MQDVSLTVEIEKRTIDNDRRLVGGFAYVSKMAGDNLSDSQGDSIDPEVLREAVHEFAKSGRTLGVLHSKGADGKTISGGEIVEMAVFSGDFRPPGMDPSVDALWIVAKVHDEVAWSLVKSGDFRGFSIGGRGTREAIIA